MTLETKRHKDIMKTLRDMKTFSGTYREDVNRH